MLRSMQSDHEEHVEDGGANNGAKSNVVLGLDTRRTMKSGHVSMICPFSMSKSLVSYIFIAFHSPFLMVSLTSEFFDQV